MVSDLSIIIVTHNSSATIEECLLALKHQTFSDFEVILVDNSSRDNTVETVEVLKSRLGYPFKLIGLKQNKGFAGGNVEGLRYANGEFIALLNPDTEPDKRWLEELVIAITSKHDIGIFASKLIVSGTDIIDSAGDGFSTSLKGFKRGEEESIFSYNKSEYVFGACAGAALYRREMLDEIGFLDEDFFLIHEDTDLNIRAQLFGWKVIYVPEAVVYHKVRSSIGKMSDMAVYYTLRNSELVRIKNIPFTVFLWCLPAFIPGIMTEFFYFTIKYRKLRLYLKAKFDALKMFPIMLKKRRQIMKNKKTSNVYLLSIMTSVWERKFFKSKFSKLLND